jgi:diguanylate cyclase (GGDEF)-like protein/PAS domain S-box-containing protein
MTIPLNVLILEDSPLDAELLVQELRRAGFSPDWRRVDAESDFRQSLTPDLDVILADYRLPQFDALAALRYLHDAELDVPFIVVTGSFEEVALECLKQGASDYLIKDRLARLGPAVAQAIEQKLLRDDKSRADAALREREQRFRALVQNASDIIFLLDAPARIRYVSPSVERVLGIPPDELLDGNFFSLVHIEDADETRRTLTVLYGQDGSDRMFELRARHRDGSWRALEAIATNLVDRPGIGGLVLNCRDVTDRKRLEDQLTRQAFYDSLTELPNRALFTDRLQHTLAGAARGAGGTAVIFLDLDGFKTVNDSLGHPFGDDLLRAVGQRLAGALRPDDTVARFGGDEFAILIERIEDLADISHVGQRLLDSLTAPFVLHGREVYAPASMGIAVSTPGRRVAQSSELLRNADAALYQAKSEGRACFRLFDEAMNHRALERLSTEGELRHAIERNELRLFYQPIVNLKTGLVAGWEALLRWQHPDRGLLLPLQFIPLAEAMGFILQLDQWVLAEACRQAALWSNEMSGRPILISVNLSAKQFQQPDLVQRVKTALSESSLPAECLELEITEGTLMNNLDLTVRTLAELKMLGVRLALDDFGTGYSSLSYVQRFPVDTIKIDRSFVAELGRTPATEAIVHAIIELAHALRMRTTAEGIETPEQLRFLRSAGCDSGQGFLFFHPMEPDSLREAVAAELAS